MVNLQSSKRVRRNETHINSYFCSVHIMIRPFFEGNAVVRGLWLEVTCMFYSEHVILSIHTNLTAK